MTAALLLSIASRVLRRREHAPRAEATAPDAYEDTVRAQLYGRPDRNRLAFSARRR
ncbi:MAG: hypothetical protein JOZ25_09500 [Actinobacteria bacterium]|nr:hypothetical protein [Actinomycetota bacterium]